jgi:hypothetical protein
MISDEASSGTATLRPLGSSDSRRRYALISGSFRIYTEYKSEELYESDCLTPSDAAAIILTIIAEASLPVQSFHVNLENTVRA